MKAAAFIIGTGILIFISRQSLGSPGSHGYYRFFAWECILGLFLLNMDEWFFQPYAWNQIISWLLLTISLIPLMTGVYSLRKHGGAVANREADASLLGFEKTTLLVTSGIYGYIRHPLYSSLLFLNWGIFFKSPSLTATALGITATTFLIATAMADELECIRYFGQPYRAYMARTKKFVPFVY